MNSVRRVSNKVAFYETLISRGCKIGQTNYVSPVVAKEFGRNFLEFRRYDRRKKLLIEIYI